MAILPSSYGRIEDGAVTNALRKISAGVNNLYDDVRMETRSGRITLWELSTADKADPRKFLQTGNNAGLGVNAFLGYALCNGNNDTPDVDHVFATDEDWHIVGASGEPAFEHSWQNLSTAVYGYARFKRTSSGRVIIHGLISTGTINQSAFTLPADYLPPNRMHIASSSNGAFGLVEIDTSGNVIPTVGSNVWFSLDTVSFESDNPIKTLVPLMRVK